MSSPYVAEIRIFAGNFAPKGWAFCDGQIMAISQNTALFSLLGTYYGGNGTSNFGLPNLQGSAPLHAGQGPGLSEYVLGESTGSTSVTVLTTEMPNHTHALMGDASALGTRPSPPTLSFARLSPGEDPYISPTASPTPTLASMSPTALTIAGGSTPHNNMQPYLGLTFIIALSGQYPARN